MRFCIYGAGAIGGFLGSLLARSGNAVTFIARGENLRAIRDNGLILEMGGERLPSKPRAVASAEEAGEQDCVILTVKAPALPAIVPTLRPMIGPETTVVTAMNGIPWWFFHGFGKFSGLQLKSIDPDGALMRALDPARIIGCVLHVAASVPAPGVVRHNNQNKFFVGEPSGQLTKRLASIVEAFKTAGIGAVASAEIQNEYWIKLLGNMTYAPVSVLTGATNDVIGTEPGLRAVCRQMIVEAIQVGRHFGLKEGMSPDERIDLGANLKGFRTSMLQDLDKSRPVELDAICLVVAEMARLAGVPVPTLDAVFALAVQRARIAGCYR
ncbi:MAG: ketopantoate reductase family protein [Alphaproteobacteria bacterium]